MKKFEIEVLDIYQSIYIIEAESIEEASDLVIDGDATPSYTELTFSEIENVKEIRYEN
tara:strand:- start:10227 stop:10400 length:174 start_codon:yes stop_codon:yes gene_type:complete